MHAIPLLNLFEETLPRNTVCTSTACEVFLCARACHLAQAIALTSTDYVSSVLIDNNSRQSVRVEYLYYGAGAAFKAFYLRGECALPEASPGTP